MNRPNISPVFEEIHDAELKNVSQFDAGGLQLDFVHPNGHTSRITIPAQCRPTFWSGGIVMPMVVSVIYLLGTINELNELVEFWADDESKRMREKFLEYGYQGGWCLVMEVNVGNTVAIFGRENADAIYCLNVENG